MWWIVDIGSRRRYMLFTTANSIFIFGCLFVYARPPPMLMRMISHSFALPTLKRAPHPQCRGHYEFNWCLPSPMFAFHTYLYQSFQLWKHRRRPPFLFFVFSCMFALASSGGHYDSIMFSQPRYQEAHLVCSSCLDTSV